MKLIVIICILIITYSPALSSKPEINLQRSSNGYSIDFEVPQFNIEQVDTLGFAKRTSYSAETFSRIHVPGYKYSDDVGKPALPALNFYMAVTAYNQIPAFEILNPVIERITLKKRCFPAQEPWIKSQSISDRRFSIDKQYYNSAGREQPLAIVNEVFSIRGVPCVRIKIAPFSYNPRENKLTVIKRFTLKINTSTVNKYNGLDSKVFEKYLKYLLVNFNDAVEPAARNDLKEDYLIISPPQWEKNLLEFITFRKYRYNVSLVTTAQTGAGIVQIEEYIKSLSPTPSYVLLIGDIDAIPSKKGSYASTDLYYSSTDADYYPEIFLGRFSIADSIDLSNIIRKTMFVEHKLYTFPRRNLFIGGKDDVFGYIAERTHDTCINYYFAPNGYENVKRYINSNPQIPKDSIVYDINKGVIFTIYSGHGLQESWTAGPWNLTGTDVINMQNSVYPFTYAFACFTGNYTVSECLTETFTRAQNGAVIAVGSSVSSMWEPDEDLQIGMVEALFDPANPQTSVGACLNAGKMSVSSSNQSYHEMYNLMGDPALEKFPVDSEPYIHVLSPDGLEEWERNAVQRIFFNDNIDSPVKIELLKSGSVVNTIVSSTPSDGIYEWKTPLDEPLGADFKIRISSVDSTQLFDTSDNNFSILEEYIIKNFPYVENFDALDTPTAILPRNWEQLSEDDFDWIVFAGPTPSRAGVPSNITGATGDHTTDTGNYIYVEASDSNYPKKKTDFLTCKFNFKALRNPALIFWCHMFSDTNAMGDLHLDVNVDGTWHTDIALLSGDHGDRWFAQSVDLASYKGDRVRFRFRAVTGTLWASDICIDDLIITGMPAFTSNPDTVAACGAQYRYDITAADDDGLSGLKIDSDTLPSWLKLTDNGNGKAVLIGIPQNSDTGSHTVVLTLFDGFVAEKIKQSFKVSVKNIALPLIKDQPDDITVTEGETATFSISATGEFLRYQWQKNGIDISGAFDSMYTTPNTDISDNGGIFRCIAINPAGTDTSNAACLTVKAISGIVINDFSSNIKRFTFEAAPNPVNRESGEVFFIFDLSGCFGGEIKIFDATGNTVAQKRFERNVRSLAWDLKNIKGAKVSGGVYLAVLILDYRDGSTRRYKKYIGIKEE